MQTKTMIVIIIPKPINEPITIKTMATTDKEAPTTFATLSVEEESLRGKSVGVGEESSYVHFTFK